jgi:CheY-like chemotaxis protein
MDVRMPVMNGLDATRLLRQRENEHRIPVVALTAGALLDERNECFEAGMDDHLSKPFTPESLIAMLSRWLTPSEVANPRPLAA